MNMELLNVEIEPSGILRAPPLEASVGRALAPEDRVLSDVTPLGVETPSLKRVRAVHHQAAKLLATGMKGVEVSMVTGICQSRLSILQNDPTFKDLLAFYSEREDSRFADAQERLVLLGLDAAAELHERITDDPESIPSKVLVDIMTASMDRSGHSPVHKHSFSFLSKDDIQKIKDVAPVATIRSRRETQKALSSDSESAVGSTGLELAPTNPTEAPLRCAGEGG